MPVGEAESGHDFEWIWRKLSDLLLTPIDKRQYLKPVTYKKSRINITSQDHTDAQRQT